VEHPVESAFLLRLANRVLRLFLPEQDYEGMSGDLAEEYETSIRPQRGWLRSALWYWGEVLLAVGAEIRIGLQGGSDGWVFGWSKDVRYALRQLRKSPGFSFSVIATLALGIGTNTAIFSFVNALLLRPFPFPGPDQLVEVYGLNRSDKSRLSIREVRDLNENTTLFGGFAGYADTGYNYGGNGGPAEHFVVTRATSELFRVLGVPLTLGGVWPATSDRSRAFEIVLTHDLWARRFQSDPAIVGKQVLMDGYPNTVTGVAAPGFKFPIREAMFRCWGIDRDPKSYDERHRREVFVVGRLKPGVSIEQGRAEVEALGRRLKLDYPLTNSRMDFGLAPLRDAYMGGVRPYLLVLLGAVGFVLLIACANVANLILARSAGRKRDAAIRIALGAARARLIRQSLVETLVFSLLGGAIGVGAAHTALQSLTGIINVELPSWMDVRVDTSVLLYTAAVSILTGMIAGVLPAIRGSRRDLGEALKQGAAGSSKPSAALSPMVTAQVAFATVLLVGAGLMMQSFARLLDVDLGFRTDRMFTFYMGLSWRKYNLERSKELEKRVLAELKRIPGVIEAGLDTQLPLTPRTEEVPIRTEGRTTARDEAESPLIGFHQVSSNYHRMMGIPVIEGRPFNDLDHDTSVKVAIVSERLAKRFWPGENPIGRKILPGDVLRPWQTEWLTVVGVSGNVKHNGPAGEPGMDLYIPFIQAGWQAASFMVRTAVPPESLHRQVLQAVARVDPEEPPTEMVTMDEIAGRTIWQRRLAGVVFTALGGLALVLATVGIYGVIAYSISQRVREIGIRSALGAGRSDILRMVTAEGARFVIPGVLIGIALALGFARAASSMLFEVSPFDPLAFGGAVIALLAIALCACLIPATRAARVDPLIALRTD
jgi:putative ABC transport system permease protein